MKSLPTDIEKLILSFVDWRPHKMKVNRAVVTHGLVKAYMHLLRCYKARRPHLSVLFMRGLVRAMNEIQ